MMVHRWMFNTRRDRYDAGLEYAGVNKRRVNRRRMENGILKYTFLLARFVVEHRYETVVRTTERTRRRELDATTIQYSCDNTIKNVSRPKVKYTYVRPVVLIVCITSRTGGVIVMYLVSSRVYSESRTDTVDSLLLRFIDRADNVSDLKTI